MTSWKEILHIKWNALKGKGFNMSVCPYRESACQSRRSWFDPWVREIPFEGNGNPLQYSCLGNPLDRGGWQAKSMGCKESDMTEHEGTCSRTQSPSHSEKGEKTGNLIPPVWWVSLHAFTVTCGFPYSWSSFSVDPINTLVFQDFLQFFASTLSSVLGKINTWFYKSYSPWVNRSYTQSLWDLTVCWYWPGWSGERKALMVSDEPFLPQSQWWDPALKTTEAGGQRTVLLI